MEGHVFCGCVALGRQLPGLVSHLCSGDADVATARGLVRIEQNDAWKVLGTALIQPLQKDALFIAMYHYV